ncbi:MAG: hypothetical protein EZS28_015845 [Streblomastix strix]|uniref:ubiquitinyl hydrolase 1 n=1 Tax=Streblomastix strix TaxID=222440 RepID=A0A5J4W1U4_9EUKA|nr:MAG: hypothetical protein EZS28_015845 [Streblomastix strix]
MIQLTAQQEAKLKQNRIQQSQTKRIALTQKREDDQYKNEPLISTEMMNKFQWCLGKDRISYTEDEYEQSNKEQGQSSIMNVDGRQNEDNIYILHSVFVHSGETNEGHYNVYIQPKCDGKWYLFNDQCVKEVDKSDAIKDNFGRLQNQELITNQNMNDENNLETNKVFSAYMLVYIKRSVLKSVLLDTIESDIPIYIREAIIARREFKTRLTFKIFTDTGLVRKYNSALLASMQALTRSKRVGRQLTKMELVKVAAQAVLNAKTKQPGQDAANQQQEEEEEPDIYNRIDNTDTTNTDQSADEAETQEIILSQLLKQQIFDVSNSVETLSISRQATLQKFREEIQAKTNINVKTMRIWRLLQKEIKEDDGIEVTSDNLFYNDDDDNEQTNDEQKEQEMDKDQENEKEKQQIKDNKQKKIDLEQKGNNTFDSQQSPSQTQLSSFTKYPYEQLKKTRYYAQRVIKKYQKNTVYNYNNFSNTVKLFFDKSTHIIGFLGRIALQNEDTPLSTAIPQIYQLLIDLINEQSKQIASSAQNLTAKTKTEMQKDELQIQISPETNEIEIQGKMKTGRFDNGSELESQLFISFPSTSQIKQSSSSSSSSISDQQQNQNEEQIIEQGKKSLLLYLFDMKTGGPGIRIPNWEYTPKQLSLFSGSQILIQLRPSKREILKDTTVNVVEWQIQKESQIHILIVDWKDEKASRALNMKVTLDRDDDYDTVSTAVAKEVEKYRQLEEIKQRKERSKARLVRKQHREKKLKERQEKNEIPDQQVLEKEEDEEEKDQEEEKNDNSTPLPTVSKQFLLLTREKANGNLADVDPKYHYTAEMMVYPEAYLKVDFTELTGEEKNGGGFQYHNLVQCDKLTIGLQKQLYYEVLAVGVPAYFANSYLLDFKVRDSVQRPLYQERYFLYKKDGNVGDILASTREIFIMKPPLQLPRNQINMPYTDIQSKLIQNSSSIQQQSSSSSSATFPLCRIFRPKFPQTAKQISLLVRLAFALAQQSEKKFECFKQYGFMKADDNNKRRTYTN